MYARSQGPEGKGSKIKNLDRQGCELDRQNLQWENASNWALLEQGANTVRRSYCIITQQRVGLRQQETPNCAANYLIMYRPERLSLCVKLLIARCFN